MNKKIALLLSFFIILSFIFSGNVYAKKITLGSRDEWLKNVEEWINIMVEDGDWFYSNDDETYYLDARAASSHRSNCALMVVHALQRFGAFGKDNKIWMSDEHEIVYRPAKSTKTQKRLAAVADVYSYKGVNPDSIDLQPGDIIGYAGHMNIYIGTKKGVKQYYDAGSGTTITHEHGGTWKSFLRTGFVNYVYKVIRLKYGQTVKVSGDTSDSEPTDNGRTDDPYENGFIGEVESSNDFTCQTILLKSNGEPTEFKKLLDGIFGILQFLAPVIAIVLTIIDYMKALSNGDTKKANKRTIIRIVLAVLVVFLPLLLDLLFHLFGLYDLSTCGIGR